MSPAAKEDLWLSFLGKLYMSFKKCSIVKIASPIMNLQSCQHSNTHPVLSAPRPENEHLSMRLMRNQCKRYPDTISLSLVPRIYRMAESFSKSSLASPLGFRERLIPESIKLRVTYVVRSHSWNYAERKFQALSSELSLPI
jgi:hypothetical protein